MRQRFCGGIAADSWITSRAREGSSSELLKNTRCDCKRQNYMSTSKVHINYTYRKMLHCDLQYPSSCVFFFFCFYYAQQMAPSWLDTDGVSVVISNIPPSVGFALALTAEQKIISTVYCLPLPFDVRLTNTCEKPGHEAMSGRHKSHGKRGETPFFGDFWVSSHVPTRDLSSRGRLSFYVCWRGGTSGLAQRCHGRY